MKPDELEQKLSRQPFRQVPAEWREEILAAADVNRRQATSCKVGREFTSAATRRSLLSTLNAQLSTLLWPHPKAWAGLAAIWILILAVNFSVRDKAPVVAEKSATPSPEVMVELRQQQRMLAELIGPRDTSVADRSKPLVPQPRSECVEIVTV
ncbi:MAG: hypothetical protein ABSF10_19430 [Verrucomicrobiota bacterium]|jgi:hypothetical protein